MYKVLYMEDEQVYRERFELSIRKYSKEKIDLDMCEDFSEAKVLVGKNKYNFIVSDLQIKGENEGFKLIALSKEKGIECALLTALANSNGMKKEFEKNLKCYVFGKMKRDHLSQLINVLAEKERLKS